MSMEYHRGRARGSYRRVFNGVSDDFSPPDSGTVRELATGANANLPSVRRVKSLWGKLVGFGTQDDDYVIGWSGFYRGDSAPPSDRTLYIHNPDFLDPKPFVYTHRTPIINEHYLNGVNLAAGEELYVVVFTLYRGGTPAFIGSFKWAQELSAA